MRKLLQSSALLGLQKQYFAASVEILFIEVQTMFTRKETHWFYGPESSSCSQNPATRSCPEPVEYYFIFTFSFSKIYFRIILLPAQIKFWS